MIKYRKISYIVSGSLVAISLLAFIVYGLNPGIDFTGGSILEVEYLQVRPPMEIVNEKIDSQNLGNVLVQPIGEKGLLMRFRDITEVEHQSLMQTLGEVDQKRFDSIGPVIGKELTRKAWTSILLVVVMIILFIAYAFRKVSKPVSSWKYGTVAITALIHDVAIPVGVFSVLGYFYHVEVDILFVTALLTILGFSVHDTIVVFDRVRENLKRGTGKDFEDTISQSVKQVRGRSLKTSFAILFVLVALLIFGGDTTYYFTLTLIIGIISGTYSSLFLASPLLVTWQKYQEKKRS
ncbi:MAG: protein translocase subunit SecF [Candidatus Marinimicrobia bacterium]|nr:protein translocase subunit SecF [Candidatus Neomarinimicrobiota bacterium]